MTDEELLLIRKGFREMTEAMKAREIALDGRAWCRHLDRGRQRNHG